MEIIEEKIKNEFKDVFVNEIFLNQYGESFAAYKIGQRIEVERIQSNKFFNYARACIYQTTGNIEVDSAIEKRISLMDAVAHIENRVLPLDIRVSGNQDRILIDGIDNLFEVTSGGWKKLISPEIRFIRHTGMEPLPEPAESGNIEEFFDYFHIENSDERLLMKVFLVCSFVPHIAHPLLAIYGAQGSGKTTLTKLLQKIIDPHAAQDIHMMGEKELLQSLSHRWFAPLDNLGRIDAAISDILCKAVTGASFSKRKLFTNDEDIIKSFRRVIIINGIDNVATKPDLLDRSIILALDRIPNSKRRDEASLWKEFEESRPRIFRGCLDILAAAMTILPEVKLSALPRMADFAIWGCAVAKALGSPESDFLRAYNKNIERQTEEALDSSPLGALILYYFRADQPKCPANLTGTPSDVWRSLRNLSHLAGVDEKYLPKSPRGFTASLQSIIPNLEAHGFSIVRSRGKERSILIFPVNGAK